MRFLFRWAKWCTENWGVWVVLNSGGASYTILFFSLQQNLVCSIYEKSTFSAYKQRDRDKHRCSMVRIGNNWMQVGWRASTLSWCPGQSYKEQISFRLCKEVKNKWWLQLMCKAWAVQMLCLLSAYITCTFIPYWYCLGAYVIFMLYTGSLQLRISRASRSHTKWRLGCLSELMYTCKVCTCGF